MTQSNPLMMTQPSNIPGYDVVVKFQQTDAGKLTMEAGFQGQRFDPEQIKTHAALDVLSRNWNDIVAQIEGGVTDADRFKALLAFAMLGHSEATRARFDTINVMLQEYDETHGLDDGPCTPEEYRASADFVIQALLETAPADGAGQGEAG